MIFNVIFDIFEHFLELNISVVDTLNLPTEMVKVLADITCYGAWIVGSDLLFIFSSSVFFWYSLKFGWGTAVYIWKLLPFT